MSNPVIPIPDREPQQMAAGDNRSWTKAFRDYSSATWALTYVIRSKKNIYTFPAVASAGVFIITLDSTTTAAWKPGLYSIGAYVTAGTEQVQVRPSFPTLLVTPNLASKPNGIDVTSFAANMVATIETTLLALVNRTVASASVNGQSYSLTNISELRNLREFYLSEVRREQAKDNLNAGLGAGNKIGIRFRPLNPQGFPPQIRVPWQ